mmetsp:Transcript_30566/g.45547  ORF Transcript_30566/g.45547 Transcript_30566/m.45547 type:complete len:100 (-) Transcript_30566:2290-2589(-)
MPNLLQGETAEGLDYPPNSSHVNEQGEEEEEEDVDVDVDDDDMEEEDHDDDDDEDDYDDDNDDGDEEEEELDEAAKKMLKQKKVFTELHNEMEDGTNAE